MTNQWIILWSPKVLSIEYLAPVVLGSFLTLFTPHAPAENTQAKKSQVDFHVRAVISAYPENNLILH